MAINKQTIINSYPLPVYNYKVTVDGIEEGMSFSEVSGLEIDHEYIHYKHGFSWLMGDYLIRKSQKPINVTLKRGVIQHRTFLYDWLRSEKKKDIRIDLCDEKGTPIVSWEVFRALPLKLSTPTFNVDTNDVAIESLNLIGHHLKLIHHK